MFVRLSTAFNAANRFSDTRSAAQSRERLDTIWLHWVEQQQQQPPPPQKKMAQEAFPLHYLVWNNQYLELDRELKKKQVNL